MHVSPLHDPCHPTPRQCNVQANETQDVWGSSVRHSPQKVGMGHELKDEDVVTIVKR